MIQSTCDSALVIQNVELSDYLILGMGKVFQEEEFGKQIFT